MILSSKKTLSRGNVVIGLDKKVTGIDSGWVGGLVGVPDTTSSLRISSSGQLDPTSAMSSHLILN